MEHCNDESLEDNVVVEDNSELGEGSNLSMIKDVSKMSIVKRNDSIKTNDVIPLYSNECTEQFQESNLSMIKDVSKMSIVKNNGNIKTNNVIPLYLQACTEQFKSVSKEFLFKYCACGYFQNVEAKIIEEMNKMESEFDEQTRIEYVNIIKTELIIKNMKTIVEMENCGVVYMLRNNKYDDLKWMYNFLSSVNGGVEVMCNGMRPYFRELGKSVLLKANENFNIKNYVQSLLDLKGKFDNLMVKLFNNDPLFDEAVGNEFDYFLTLCSSTPIFLSLFLDEKLRRGKHTYIKKNPEADIDKVIFMIKYLKNKVQFESSYQISLSHRLLYFKSVSTNNESLMISKLESAYNGYGTLFISKLKSMVWDKFVLSKIIMINYEERILLNECIFGISKPFDFDIDVSVITSVNWPVDLRSKHEIPSFGLRAFNQFNTFYKENIRDNAKRKLMILPQYGTVEINAVFYGDPCLEKQIFNELPSNSNKRQERKVKLEVTTYQMCVLDLFNAHNTLTFEEIQKKTKIPRFDLVDALITMMDGDGLTHLLLKTPKAREFKPDDKFYVNESFDYRM